MLLKEILLILGYLRCHRRRRWTLITHLSLSPSVNINHVVYPVISAEFGRVQFYVTALWFIVDVCPSKAIWVSSLMSALNQHISPACTKQSSVLVTGVLSSFLRLRGLFKILIQHRTESCRLLSVIYWTLAIFPLSCRPCTAEWGQRRNQICNL